MERNSKTSRAKASQNPVDALPTRFIVPDDSDFLTPTEVRSQIDGWLHLAEKRGDPPSYIEALASLRAHA